MNTFEIAPSPNLMETISHSGYTLEAAIADLIDNSISGKARNISVDFNYRFMDSTVTITDDGYGMSLEDLKDSLRIAHKSIRDNREVEDLGRFSLGLKSASASYCRKLSISTKKLDNNQFTAVLDFDHLLKVNKWEAFLIENPREIQKHGTIITWEHLSFIENDEEKAQSYFN
ncbi:MAG: ATP-binding protein, partial [bacterium]